MEQQIQNEKVIKSYSENTYVTPEKSQIIFKKIETLEFKTTNSIEQLLLMAQSKTKK